MRPSIRHSQPTVTIPASRVTLRPPGSSFCRLILPIRQCLNLSIGWLSRTKLIFFLLMHFVANKMKNRPSELLAFGAEFPIGDKPYV